MLCVPLIPVGTTVMTWIWSFACDVSMKNILKIVWPFFFWYSSAFHSNVDLVNLTGSQPARCEVCFGFGELLVSGIDILILFLVSCTNL
jgi:hypothetical protein